MIVKPSGDVLRNICSENIDKFFGNQSSWSPVLVMKRK